MAIDLFDHAAAQLERHTDLDRLEARGTLRLAIKLAGLEAKRLTLHQLEAVFEKVMPEQLAVRGIDSTATTCSTVMAEIARTAETIEAGGDNSDEIFQRLGGRRP